MDNIILTSTGLSNPRIAKRVREFFGVESDILIDKKAAIITTASEDKEGNEFALLTHSQLSQMGFGQVEFFDIEKRYARELLDFDLIYVNGGNTYYLLDWTKKSGFDDVVKEFLKKGGLYVGASAGSLIAGISIEVLNFVGGDENFVGLKDFSAIGLIDKAIVPHYTDGDEAAILEYEKRTRFEVVRLADGMGFAGKMGGKFEAIE
jgi:dipeptidase E